MVREKPSEASTLAMASPMPLDAPVTIAARCADICVPSSGERNRAAALLRTAGGSIPYLAGSVSRVARAPRERARSSVGQSCRLIIGRSLVRVQPGPPRKALCLRDLSCLRTGVGTRCEPLGSTLGSTRPDRLRADAAPARTLHD